MQASSGQGKPKWYFVSFLVGKHLKCHGSLRMRDLAELVPLRGRRVKGGTEALQMECVGLYLGALPERALSHGAQEAGQA